MEVLQVCAPASARRGPPWRGRHGRRFADGSGGPRKTAPQARPYRPLDHEVGYARIIPLMTMAAASRMGTRSGKWNRFDSAGAERSVVQQSLRTVARRFVAVGPQSP